MPSPTSVCGVLQFACCDAGRVFSYFCQGIRRNVLCSCHFLLPKDFTCAAKLHGPNKLFIFIRGTRHSVQYTTKLEGKAEHKAL